jgi:hypothetical protein
MVFRGVLKTHMRREILVMQKVMARRLKIQQVSNMTIVTKHGTRRISLMAQNCKSLMEFLNQLTSGISYPR